MRHYILVGSFSILVFTQIVSYLQYAVLSYYILICDKFFILVLLFFVLLYKSQKQMVNVDVRDSVKSINPFKLGRPCPV